MFAFKPRKIKTHLLNHCTGLKIAAQKVYLHAESDLVPEKKVMDCHLEDSQDLGRANLAFRQCYKHALSSKDRETGGYFYFDTDFTFSFRSCGNLNTLDKDQYSFRDIDFYKHYINDQIICLFHTHIDKDVTPSPLDIATSHSFRLPSYILSTSSKNSHLFYPENYIPRPLDKRQFVPLFQDCLSYIKDYLFFNFNINLNKLDINWARPKLHANKIMLKYFKLYFNEVSVNDMQKGDVLVFPESISEHLHLAVFNEKDRFFHHPMFRYPESELITKDILNKVYKVYRYKDL